MKTFLGIFSALVIGIRPLFAQEPAPPTTSDMIQAIQEVVNVLQKNGLPLDALKARNAVVEALIRTADSQGRLMTETDIAQMNEENNGIRYEVGIHLVRTNEAFVISEVTKESAAEKAGLQSGDVVLEIDKGNIASLKPLEVLELLRGPANRTVQLKIQETNSTTREVEVKREPVQTGAILVAEELPANLCYLKLNGIFERSGKDIVSTMRGWAETGRAGVVLDLRGAGGADAPSAADTASLFAESGEFLFAFRDTQDQDIGVYKSNATLPLNMPAMILIDEETLGASELLAAALAGRRRGAMLIGATTGGDPLVREVIKLPDGNHLYLASKRLVVADGQIYNGSEGVKPDLIVAPTAAPATDYEPEPVTDGKKQMSDEEKEDHMLRQRIHGDEILRRAVDVLLGLKALNIRGVERAENPTH